jgi:hypothetical protein
MTSYPPRASGLLGRDPAGRSQCTSNGVQKKLIPHKTKSISQQDLGRSHASGRAVCAACTVVNCDSRVSSSTYERFSELNE